MLINSIIFALGVLLLIRGSDSFIKNASLLAQKVGVSELLIGLTLGALGTSMPELFVSYLAAFLGNSGIAIGNVSGSNMANIGLALGLGAICMPVVVDSELLKKDYPVLLLSALLFLIVSRDMNISRAESALLFFCGIIYFFTLYKRGRGGSHSASGSDGRFVLRALFFSFVGLLLLIAGAHIVVYSAAEIAKLLGVSEALIAIAVVAVGTSLPEISVVIAGSFKNSHQISAGTIVGSNIFNIFLVAGGAGVIGGGFILSPKEYIFHAPAVLLFSVMLLAIFFFGRRIGRAKGVFLLLCYFAYIALAFLL